MNWQGATRRASSPARRMHDLLCRAGVLALTLAASSLALAAEPRVASGTLVAPAVGAGTSIPSLGLAGVMQALLGLAAVLALVMACAWLARRFGLQAPRLGSAVKVVGGVMLTTKERVVVVEVQGTWLVLGVAPGKVSMLHALPAEIDDLDDPAESGAAVPFADRLRDSLVRRFGAKPTAPAKRPDTPSGRGMR
jgi:flagellar protein FliO/FliZ